MFNRVLQAVTKGTGTFSVSVLPRALRPRTSGHHHVAEHLLPPPSPFSPAIGVLSKPAAANRSANAVSRVHVAPEMMQQELRLIELVRKINSSLPPRCEVKPWALLPATLWQGPNSNFLSVACGFYPSSFANTLLLPTNIHAAALLRLPRLPPFVAPLLEQDAAERVSALRADFAQDHAHVAQLLEKGSLRSVEESQARHEKYKRDVAAVAHTLGVAVFGPAALERHQELFGHLLQPGSDLAGHEESAVGH